MALRRLAPRFWPLSALLRQDRVAESLPLLQKALTLHLAEYDGTHSLAVAKVRVELAEAEQRAGR